MRRDSRWLRRSVWLLALLLVGGATAGSAARITLVITDKPNQGFLSTAPPTFRR